VGDWYTIASAVENVLNDALQVAAGMPPVVLAAAFFIPLVIALLAREILPFLAVLILEAVSFIALVRPVAAIAAVAMGSYAGSLLVVGAAIRSNRRFQARNAELEALRSDVDQLLRAESQRVMVELKSN
jgi:hypothetical protein